MKRVEPGIWQKHWSMSRLLYNLIILHLLLLGCPIAIQAQVFPGDADNNGRVEHYDLLPIGYAYGTIGPARQDAVLEFESQNILADWDQVFPNGVNYAFADANGNGLVEVGDFLAVNLNYGSAQGFVEPIEIISADPALDPGFHFDLTVLPDLISQSQILQIPLLLGTPLQPASLCGFTFELEYESEFVQNVFLDFSESWLSGSDNNLFYFQRTAFSPASAVISAAQTRYGPNPVTGFGEIGMLSIVIEDDLIGLLPADMDSTHITLRLKAGLAVDGQFDPVPILSDSVELTIYHPDYLLSSTTNVLEQELKLYPNPASGTAWLQLPDKWRSVALYDQLGRCHHVLDFDGRRAIPLDLTTLTSGLYLVSVQTDYAMVTKTLQVE